MKCREIQNNLDDYILNDLEKSLHSAVSQHLRNCPACRNEYQRIKIYHDTVRDSQKLEPPSDFVTQTMKRINERRSSSSNLFHILFLPLRIKLPLEALGLVLLSITLFLVYRPYSYIEQYQSVPPVPTVQKDTHHKKTYKMKKNGIFSKGETETIHAVMTEKESMPPAEDADRLADDKTTLKANEEFAAEKKKEIVPIAITLNVPGKIVTGTGSMKKQSPAFAASKSSSDIAGGAASLDEVKAEKYREHTDDVTKKVKVLIRDAKGVLLKFIEKKEEDSLVIELPQASYNTFMHDLGLLGKIQQVTLPQDQLKSSDKIHLNLLIKHK